MAREEINQIAFDLDGVLRNWHQTLLTHLNRRYDKNLTMDDIDKYDLAQVFRRIDPGFNLYKTTHQFIDDFRQAPAFEDGLALLNKVDAFIQDGMFERNYEIIILTHQPDYDWELEAGRWVMKYIAPKLFNFGGVFFSSVEGKASRFPFILIDDNPAVISSAWKLEVPSILWTRPWNRDAYIMREIQKRVNKYDEGEQLPREIPFATNDPNVAFNHIKDIHGR